MKSVSGRNRWGLVLYLVEKLGGKLFHCLIRSLVIGQKWVYRIITVEEGLSRENNTT